MTTQLHQAISVFVHGFCVGKSRTHPYEAIKVEGAWLLRDAPRTIARDLRKEEFVACGIAPARLDRIARRHTRGRYFICDIRPNAALSASRRQAFQELGYRLLATEPLFVHSLSRIPRANAPCEIRVLDSADLAAKLGKATRTRPLPPACFGVSGSFRQYVALDGAQPVGWVRSVPVGKSTWCADLAVVRSHRRRGIGRGLVARMLRDDRRLGVSANYLLASHAGALLYPQLGYAQLGTLFMYAPRKA